MRQETGGRDLTSTRFLFASPYLINATYSVLIANLARPIGEFDTETELAAYKKTQKEEAAAAAGEPPIDPTATIGT